MENFYSFAIFVICILATLVFYLIYKVYCLIEKYDARIDEIEARCDQLHDRFDFCSRKLKSDVDQFEAFLKGVSVKHDALMLSWMSVMSSLYPHLYPRTVVTASAPLPQSAS
jgi:hypothetical protein